MKKNFILYFINRRVRDKNLIENGVQILWIYIICMN